MKKVMKKIIALSILTGLSTHVLANQGDSTLSFGYANSDLQYSGIKKDDKSSVNITASDRNVLGINIKYRHEFTDKWGAITSFTNTQTNHAPYILVDKKSPKDITESYKLQYNSMMIGPIYRASDWLSIYAMAGIGNGRVHIHAYKSVPRVQDEYHNSENKYDIALSAGLQVHPMKKLTVDLAFDRNKISHLKANNIILGLGWNF